MYDEFYGLTGRPFQLTPDPHFWFDTAAHKKAMAYLGYGLSQGEGFIVITGDVGAGKTTLVGHLLERIDRERLHAITIASTQIGPDDLLRIVAAGLNVAEPGATKADLLAAIERGLHAVARSGRRTLLIVDEAQALPPSALEELRMLSNLSAGGHALLQIFLLGQPEFRALLEGPGRLEQLRQRVIALHHLDPMGLEEVEPYMAHRLALVGWNGAPRFTDAAFTALYHGSGGVPRLLNQVAGRTLLFGAIEGLDTIDADAVEGALADIARDLPQPRDEAEPGVGPAFEGDAEPGPEAIASVAAFAATRDAADAIDRLAERVAALEAREGDTAAEPAHVADYAARLTALETEPASAGLAQVAELTARLAALEEQPAPAPAVALSGLADRLTVLEEQPAPVPVEELADLADRLAAAEAAARAATDASRPVAAEIAALSTRLLKVEKQAEAGPAASQTVTHVATLAARLNELEAQVGDAAAAARLDRSVFTETADLAARMAGLEAQIEDQDATLRRILTLLVDWVENGQRPPVPPISLRA